jgi:tripartite-type tricarboxylate transporter receptor subunit TctC
VSISERRKNRVETPPIVSKSRRRQRRTVEAAMPHGHPFRVYTSNLPRRRFLHLAAGAAALPAVPRIARAQAYPSRTVTMVVPFAAGGTPDVVARIVGEHMSRTLKQQFIVENVPGGGGTTGSTRVMRAKSDGYTILMGGINTHVFSVSFYPNLAYMPDVDFVPIGVVFEAPTFIVARRDFPPRDLKEFVAYVKANAERLNMAHAGVGSGRFTFGLLLNSLLGVKPTMVPFNGAAPAVNALLGGQIDYMCLGIAEVGPQLQGGTIKAYAIGTTERHPNVPNVPTSKEAGLPEFQASQWTALFAPKGLPRPILDQLTDALDKALDDQNVRKRLLDIGGDIPGKAKRGEQPLAELMKSEVARWTPIINAAKTKAE